MADTIVFSPSQSVTFTARGDSPSVFVALGGSPASNTSRSWVDLTSQINGSRVAFTLPDTPMTALNGNTTLMLNFNGTMLMLNDGFTLSGVTATLTFTPQVGDKLFAFYF